MAKIDLTGQKYIHIHCHSHYSLLDGLSSPEDLVEKASSLGMKALSLTDHGMVAGLLNFQKECKEKEILPILGMETYVCKDMSLKDKDEKIYHLILLAKNDQGFRNLMHLSTEAWLKGKYKKPRIDFDLLSKFHDGIICSSACSAGEIPTLLFNNMDSDAVALASKYKELFGDDFYIEIMMHNYFKDKEQEGREKDLARKLYKLAKSLGIKAIATNDLHYANKEDHKYHDLLLSINTLDTIKNPNRFTFDSDDFYMKSYDEMLLLYKSAPELLSNTVEIASKIESSELLHFTPDLLPSFTVPTGYNSEEEYLKAMVKDGMRSFGLMDKPEYRERIKFEMETIIKCKYTRYFLILWDIVNYAKNNHIAIGCGRGSAVGSLCMYVLGITKLDPIKYDLLFERFLNPDRVSPPDVDMDFDDSRRAEIFEYVINKYGADKCCKIGTYNSMKARATIRSVVKALDIGGDWEILQEKKSNNPDAKIELTKNSLNLADKIAKLIPAVPNMTVEIAYKDSEEFRKEVDRYKGLRDYAKHMESTLTSAGVHAAGVVVCKEPVDMHLAMRESKDQVCTQFTGPEVEELGLLKFDFLGLKNITIIDKTIKLIKQRHSIDLKLDELVPDDPKVFGLFNGVYNMDTRGIFQFESYGMQKLLKDIHVDSFEDLVVANALYRPGPLGARVHQLYCDYKHGRKKIDPLHPRMADILKSTYGVMAYQEDFMKIARELAGFTRGQSDTLRKCVGKKKIDLLKQQKDLFVNGCVKNGVDVEIAKKIFEQIEFFGGYGFNRSHSAAYSFLAYQTAYLKVYYPLEFMCNLLTFELGDKEQWQYYFEEAKRMNIIMKCPNINKSGNCYTVEKGINVNGEPFEFLRSPLSILDGIGDKTVNNIVVSQPYKNLEEFLSKVEGRSVSAKIFETLVEKGCMDGEWKMSRAELLKQYPIVKKQIEESRNMKKKQGNYLDQFGGGSLFDRLGDGGLTV